MRRLALLLTIALFASMLVPAPAAAAGKELRFSIKCDWSHAAQVDPIVSPGGPSAHLHEFFGNRHTDEHRHPLRFMRRQGTTCELRQDTAAYWVPTLRAPDGSRVEPIHMLAYYRHSEKRGQVAAHPANFMAAPGIGTAQSFDWLCLDSQTFTEPPNCDTAERKHRDVGLRIVFDQVQLDNGKVTPRLAINVRYAIKDARGAYLDTDVAPHGDFWNTWRQRAYNTLVARCLDQNGVWATYTAAEWEARCNQVTDADFKLGD